MGRPMATETVELRDRSGAAVEAQADLRRYSDAARMARGLPIAVGGVVLGACSILIPAVHLISTWLLPLLGGFIGWYVYRIRLVVGAVRGTCPKCGEAFEAEGGTWDEREALWLRCNHCAHPLQLTPRR